MNTKGRIADKALELFNERGIEYVGLRELAALLDMRVSNITYYFPTKDDLVYHLSLELNRLNSGVMVERRDLNMTAFLQMLHQVFRNHVQFRCLLLSFVHLMKQNKVMASKYSETQNVRNATLASNVRVLAKAGYLKVNSKSDVAFLVSTLALISRFWISEAAISYQHLSVDKQITHYLTIIATLLLPYATPKATQEIQAFLKGLP